jgi:hypothetical protein
MAAPILSEQETRELASAQPNTAFAYMMHGGSGAADPNRVSLFHIDVPAVRDSSTKDVYDFCADPARFLQHTTSGVDGAPPWRTMGEWALVATPPDVLKARRKAKKDQTLQVISLKPGIEGLKRIFAYNKRGVSEWAYPDRCEA